MREWQSSGLKMSDTGSATAQDGAEVPTSSITQEATESTGEKDNLSTSDGRCSSASDVGTTGACQRPPSSNSSTGGDGGSAAVAGSKGQGVTKVIYHVDEQRTPYLVKVPGSVGSITLKAFKAALNRPSTNFKFFFHSNDDDFG